VKLQRKIKTKVDTCLERVENSLNNTQYDIERNLQVEDFLQVDQDVYSS